MVEKRIISIENLFLKIVRLHVIHKLENAH